MGEGHSPSYLENFQYVKDVLEDACWNEWNVLAELGVEPLGEAFIALILPTTTDVLRAYVRPKGLRTGGHLRRILRRSRERVHIPDTSEVIGKKIPGHRMIRGRRTSSGVKFLWNVDGVIQRGFWYWLILDVTNDFLVNWASAIQRSGLTICHLDDQALVTNGPNSRSDASWWAEPKEEVQQGVTIFDITGPQAVPTFETPRGRFQPRLNPVAPTGSPGGPIISRNTIAWLGFSKHDPGDPDTPDHDQLTFFIHWEYVGGTPWFIQPSWQHLSHDGELFHEYFGPITVLPSTGSWGPWNLKTPGWEMPENSNGETETGPAA